MPIGPGKFDEECTRVREATKAVACVLMVFGEEPGTSGFSVQARSDVVLNLPNLLRQMADDMEQDLKRKETNRGNC